MLTKTTKCLLLGLAVLIFGSSISQVAYAEARKHDGFFLQAAGGFAFSSSTAVKSMAGGPSYSGIALPLSVAVGGTLFDHLVVGGAFFVDYIPSPRSSFPGGGDVFVGNLTQLMIGVGPMIDFYFDPNDGLHVPFFIGWSTLATAAGGTFLRTSPIGFSAYSGLGYDWFVSDEWSIGILGRLSVGILGQDRQSYVNITPALMFTVTLH